MMHSGFGGGGVVGATPSSRYQYPKTLYHTLATESTIHRCRPTPQPHPPPTAPTHPPFFVLTSPLTPLAPERIPPKRPHHQHPPSSSRCNRLGSRASIAPETARDSFPSRYSLSRCGTRDGIGGDRWFLRFLPCVPRFVSDPCASACVVRDVLLRAALSVCQMACLSPCLRSGLRGGGAMVWRRGQRDGGFERCSEGTGNYPVGCRRVA